MIESKKYTQSKLTEWTERIEKKQLSLQNNLMKIQEHKKNLPKDQEQYEEWREILEISDYRINTQINIVSSLLKDISNLKSNKKMDDLFKQFRNINPCYMSNTELRCLMYVWVDSVTIDFQNNNRLQIVLRYTPFVGLENSIVQITEEPQYRLDGLPNIAT